MGRFGDGWTIYDEIAAVIADRADDWDREVIEDLMLTVGPEALYELAVGPMIDKVMERIGLGNVTLPQPGAEQASRPILASASTVRSLASGSLKPGQQPPEGGIALVWCSCPHCNHGFMTTVESIVNRESDNCPECGKEIVPEPSTEGGP
jgi:hypothetical protein